ncbi:MAG: hypothetical protein OEQ74_08290 [Gammaproteobacteria bacterium]|nr:hypothetical protein [Gammaproteobacteria bacterium]
MGNDTAFDLNALTIYFDFDLYDFNLIESPAGSGEFIVDPLDSISPGGMVLLLPTLKSWGFRKMGFSTSPGDPLLGGFSVTFAFNGIGTPGSQFFEYFGTDSAGNNITGSSFTQLMGGPQPMHEPSVLLLLATGWLVFARQRIRSTRRGFGADRNSRFFTIGGLMSGSAVRMTLIKNMYVPYIARLIAAGQLLAEADALQADSAR